MKTSLIIDALALPPESRVDQRIAKKLLVENGSFTAADKKAINEGIEELTWIAALKSSNCAVPVYKDEEREYIEIAVLLLSFRDSATMGGAKVGGQKESRIIELLHRAIPYPVFLIAKQADRILLSLASKRWAQNEGGKVVLDGEAIIVLCEDRPWNNAFLSGINLGKQDRRDFLALYQSWMARLVQYNVSLISGIFRKAGDARDMDLNRAALDEHAKLQSALAVLRSAALKESQINRRVEMNLEIKLLTDQLEDIREVLRA